MKKSKSKSIAAVMAAVLTAITAGCAPKAVQMDLSNAPDTPNCQFAKESCKEAEAFSRRYEGMSKEEQEDAKAVLNAYVQQCQDASELCMKSAHRAP